MTKKRASSSNKVASSRRFGADKLLRFNRFGPVVFLLVFAAAGAAFAYSTSASRLTGSTDSSAASISITPNKQTLSGGQTLRADVWVDSRDVPANAVQTAISYPADKLIFLASDYTSSQFTVQAEETNQPGRLVIARGSMTPLTGKQLVASLTFKPVDNASGKAAITFGADSQLLDIQDGKNILGQFLSGTYTIRK